MPSDEQPASNMDEHSKTFIGKIFPIFKAERQLIFLASLMFSVIVFAFSFLWVYKDSVIYTVMSPSVIDYLELINLLTSVTTTSLLSNTLSTYGVNDGFDRILRAFVIIFLAVMTLLATKYYVQPCAYSGKQIFVGRTCEVRGMVEVRNIYNVLNFWVMGLFYILVETLVASLVTYVFFLYMSKNFTDNQLSRFVRFILLCSNFTQFLTNILYKHVLTNCIFKHLSFAQFEWTYPVVCLILAVTFQLLRVLKWRLDNEIDKAGRKVGEVTPKIETKQVSTVDCLMIVFNSKLLMALSTMTLFFNFVLAFNLNLSKSVYNTYADYLQQNPSLPFSGMRDAKGVGAYFQTTDGMYSALIVTVLFIQPYTPWLFEQFGVLLFGNISVISSLMTAGSATYFTLCNYQFTGRQCYMNVRIDTSTCSIEQEAYAVTAMTVILKASKNGFIDIMKEAVGIKIDPEYRALFKGISEFVCYKVGKASASMFGVIMRSISGMGDIRSVAWVYGVVIVIFAILWVIAIIHLHRVYSQACKKDGRYMSPGFTNRYSKQFQLL